jgi:hypothetical protein
MMSFDQVVQHHRRLHPYSSRVTVAKNCARGSNATVLDRCHTGGLRGLAAADLLHGRSGDVRRKRQQQSESGRRDLPGQFAIPPEISTGALSPPGQAPAPAEW